MSFFIIFFFKTLPDARLVAANMRCQNRCISITTYPVRLDKHTVVDLCEINLAKMTPAHQKYVDQRIDGEDRLQTK